MHKAKDKYARKNTHAKRKCDRKNKSEKSEIDSEWKAEEKLEEIEIQRDKPKRAKRESRESKTEIIANAYADIFVFTETERWISYGLRD